MTENQIGKFTEVVADDGKYITQAAEVWDARVFCTRRVLTSGETASDWRDATQKEKDDYEAFTTPPQQKPCRTALTPMFEAAGAVFNDETGYYEMNGLTDLTEGQMQYTGAFTMGMRGDLVFLYLGWGAGGIRTNFRPVSVGSFSLYLCNQIEVLNIIPIGYWKSYLDDYAMQWQPKARGFDANIFYNATKLRKVIGKVDLVLVSSSNQASYPLNALEEILLKRVHFNLAMFAQAPKTNLAMWQYMVAEATNTVAITFTVHPDVYAKLMDEANAEWYAVNVAAREKQIAFATTETARPAGSRYRGRGTACPGGLLSHAGRGHARCRPVVPDPEGAAARRGHGPLEDRD